jgi:hypothetical protein
VLLSDIYNLEEQHHNQPIFVLSVAKAASNYFLCAAHSATFILAFKENGNDISRTIKLTISISI